MAPRAPRDAETALARWSRRVVTIPGFLVAALVAVGSLPVLLPLAALHDGLRGNRWGGVRTALALTHYLIGEALGIFACGVLWLAARFAPARSADWNFALQCLWARWLFGGARRLYGLRVRVTGEDALERGPLLLLVRHASVIDTLLPAVLVSSRHALRLRYVMKRELSWDPCLDLVGQRLPNAFVRRGLGGSETEIARVRELARGLGARDGVMLYPEGTRYTAARRRQVLERMAASADPELLERARRLEHVLPPRLGGVLALLEEAPEADVVVCAHSGLEDLRTLADLVGGALVGRSLEVAFWRIAAASIPSGREARIDWLFQEWARVDAWLGARLSPGRIAA